MTPEDHAKLRAPFPPEAIGHLPKGGVVLDYVGHAATTDRLLQVDPDWSWEPFALTDAGLPALDVDGNLWIRLTVCGVTRLGVGDGKNMKERIGDAIRNAAMRFGVALDLWAKEDLGGEPATGQTGRGAPKTKAAHKPAEAADAASPPSAFTPPVTGQPSETELADLTKLVDTLIAAGKLTNEQLMKAAKCDTPWPFMASELDRSVVIDLVARFTRFAANERVAIPA